MEDESRVTAAGPRGLAGPDDESSVSPTAVATAAEDQGGLMQQDQKHEQQDDGVAAGQSGLSPTDTTTAAAAAASETTNTTTTTSPTGDESSHSSGTTPTPTAIPTPTTSGHDTSSQKSPPLPADVSTSPRGGSTAGFVAPSDYLRPLAVPRERDDHHRSEHRTEGESVVRRPMHPLDTEQKEGLVSWISLLSWSGSILSVLKGNDLLTT